MEILSLIIIPVVLCAFFFEFIDATVGMGYGTAMTPVLLLMGYHPLEIIPAVLISNIAIGLTAGFFHQKFKNVDFRNWSREFRIALVLSSLGMVGAIAGAFLVFHIPEKVVILYIGIMVIIMGILTLINWRPGSGFSWWRIIFVGIIASFNKGASGGGYGPVITTGQLMSGVEPKKALGIALLSEGIVSVAGTIAYFNLDFLHIRWDVTVSLLIGSLISIPLAAFAVSKMKSVNLKKWIGIASIIIGLVTLVKLF